MKKAEPIDRKAFEALLDIAKELYDHALWMGIPAGYSYSDFKPLFDRFEFVIEDSNKKVNESNDSVTTTIVPFLMLPI